MAKNHNWTDSVAKNADRFLENMKREDEFHKKDMSRLDYHRFPKIAINEHIGLIKEDTRFGLLYLSMEDGSVEKSRIFALGSIMEGGKRFYGYGTKKYEENFMLVNITDLSKNIDYFIEEKEIGKGAYINVLDLEEADIDPELRLLSKQATAIKNSPLIKDVYTLMAYPENYVIFYKGEVDGYSSKLKIPLQHPDINVKKTLVRWKD